LALGNNVLPFEGVLGRIVKPFQLKFYCFTRHLKAFFNDGNVVGERLMGVGGAL
jgi:hypothetical protein